jgi:para-aminobenzoate synthetase component 1
VKQIKEFISRGDTYQANLTQKFRVELSPGLRAADIFLRLRRDNPAPFAAFIDRGDSIVVSASPERFFRVANGRIETSPIKGTRSRGADRDEDEKLRNELLVSAKDRAENTMIVDLLRNDLGRVCKFGTVVVDALCELEELPTLFHLVSTVSGELEHGIEFGDIIRAIFPCGSITGAPKIRTMEIIDDIESEPRGLSMGAIGYFVPETGFDLKPGIDLSVAIRTMVIRDSVAEFNVGGGVVSDSDPDAEYEESLLKAKALLAALGADFSG